MNREVMAKLRGKMKAAELSHCVAELSSRTAELNHNVMQKSNAKLIRIGEAGRLNSNTAEKRAKVSRRARLM